MRGVCQCIGNVVVKQNFAVLIRSILCFCLEMSMSHLLDNPLEGSFEETAASAADRVSNLWFSDLHNKGMCKYAMFVTETIRQGQHL